MLIGPSLTITSGTDYSNSQTPPRWKSKQSRPCWSIMPTGKTGWVRRMLVLAAARGPEQGQTWNPSLAWLPGRQGRATRCIRTGLEGVRPRHRSQPWDPGNRKMVLRRCYGLVIRSHQRLDERLFPMLRRPTRRPELAPVPAVAAGWCRGGQSIEHPGFRVGWMDRKRAAVPLPACSGLYWSRADIPENIQLRTRSSSQARLRPTR